MDKYIVLNIQDLNSFYLKDVYFNKLLDYYRGLSNYQVVIISKVYYDKDFVTFSSFKDFIYNKEGMYIYFSNPTLIYNIDEINKIFNNISKKKNIKIYKKEHFIGVGRFINKDNVLPYIYNSKSSIFQIISNKSITVLNSILQKYINEIHINNGVNIIDSKNTYISYHSKIDKDTTIYPFSYILDSKIGRNCDIGPHVTIRNNSIIKDNCRIGNFVEIKKSYINDFTKIAHLSYIGDTIIGKNVNIGCGVVTCNYDGFNKHQTIISDNAFIGSNVNLIAPITIGSNSFIAAGSTICSDVDDFDFVIERGKQINKKEYAKKMPYMKNTSTM